MLQAAHGLVRCGACLSIFEANRNLVDRHSHASNDDREHLDEESVFISAPGDYFDPAEFLSHGDDQDEDWGQEEALYPKSDIHDSDFDVFDVDPADVGSPAREQTTDSNFNVFEADDRTASVANPHHDVQDHEFDIYDAGERKISKAASETRQGDDGRFQLRASFKFPSGTTPSSFSLTSLLGSLLPGSSSSAARNRAARKSPTVAESRVQDGSQSSEVILPKGPDAASLLARLKESGNSEVILPAGPDSTTLLEALKKANERSKKHPGGDACEPHRDSDFLYDDEDLEPAEARFLDVETIEPADALNETELNEVNVTDDQFFDALAGDAEWEEADVELDEKSFVILPVDPYQPSAFKSENETMPEKSEPRGKENKALKGRKASSGANTGGDNRQGQKEPRTGGGRSVAKSVGNASESDTTPHTGPATISRGAKSSRDNSGKAADSPGQARCAEKSRPEGNNGKEQLRARVMNSGLDDQDSLEQLSEENLRAIRDVDNSLELENRNTSRRASKIALIASACLLAVLVFAVQLAWQRLPVLSQDPGFRPWYLSACSLVGCDLPPYVNPTQIQTDNLVVRSHPQLADTLELNAVFRNRAEFPQPFPLIELRFSDLNNSTIDSRQLLPDEYLPQALRGMPLMPPGAPVQITLELADPGPSAVNYQLGFKAAPPRPGS